MALGDYEQLKQARSVAWRRMRLSAWGSREHQEREEAYDELKQRGETYLRELLANLPFRWHIARAYTPNESPSYGGADHIIVDKPVHIGRLRRKPGDALSRPRAKFWGLSDVEENRLPTSLAHIRIAERIVASLPSKR